MSAVADIDMSGFELSDGYWSYNFPLGFILGADESVTVHTGIGTDTTTDLYWGYETWVWNDDGDTAHLYDEHGDSIDSYSYPY